MTLTHNPTQYVILQFYFHIYVNELFSVVQLFPQPHKVFACCRKTHVITLGWLPRNNSPRSETYGSDNCYISLYVTAQLLLLGAVGSVL